VASERDCVDQFVRHAGKPDLSLSELIALGLLVTRKWDKARSASSAPSANVTFQEASAFDSFTSDELAQFRDTANRTLSQHLAHHTASMSKDGWWRGFWQGVAAAFFYSFLLALIAFIIKLLGSDFITLLKTLLT
jgi:hypothetical protein